MYFVNKIKEEYANKKVIIFTDMDGVIADYEFGKEISFKNKRPIKTNIDTLMELSKEKNIDINVLSICKKDKQIIDKNNWLNKYAQFIEKRVILSKETYPDISSKELKKNYLQEFIKKTSDEVIIMIDDDNDILEYLSKHLDIVLFQDSSIID